MRIHPVGTRALLIELEDLSQVMAWHSALDAHPLKDQVDAIAAATTLLLTFATPNSAAAAAERLEDFHPSAQAGDDPRLVEIDVLYDGEDLEEAAELMGMSLSLIHI